MLKLSENYRKLLFAEFADFLEGQTVNFEVLELLLQTHRCTFSVERVNKKKNDGYYSFLTRSL
jgi:hypothetical protein